MKTFIDKSSIVRKIWSTTDVTLFIFAGASAEFALNKQVDWLFFTGKLPADPIGRLFSTIQYAQQIIFSKEDRAWHTIDSINNIHQNVESARERKIPQAAYRDVLYMLIYYSIATWELLEKKLTMDEKNEIVQTFARIGSRMHIDNLPLTFSEWSQSYQHHLEQNLENTFYTKELFGQYRKHIGAFRYFLLLEIQRMLVSPIVNKLLRLGGPGPVTKLISVYKLTRKSALNSFLISIVVPQKFRPRVRSMYQINTSQARC